MLFALLISRCCVEVSIALHLRLYDRIIKSSHLGFGSDETPHQKAGRSFLEIHVFGCLEGEFWCSLLYSVELFGSENKTARATVDNLLDAYSYLQKFGMLSIRFISLFSQLGKDFPALHEFYILSYDNCPTNTGEFNGVGKLWGEEREKSYRAIYGNTDAMIPTICRGCKDHESAMFGKHFASGMLIFFSPDLIVRSSDNVQREGTRATRLALQRQIIGSLFDQDIDRVFGIRYANRPTAFSVC